MPTSRDDIITWCEATPNVDDLFAQGSNALLVRRSRRWCEAALKDLPDADSGRGTP